MSPKRDSTFDDLQRTIAKLRHELAQSNADRDEAVSREAAVAQVLEAINHSTFDLGAVLQTVVSVAHRLCRADQAVLFRNVSGEYRWAAGHDMAPGSAESERNAIILPGRGTLIGRAVLARAAVQIRDALDDFDFENHDDARGAGTRSMLGVPLLREGVPIGAIGLARNRVEPFSGNEVRLVTTFADQAVIAIENARLITETREALAQQTATAEVLQVINSSPGDLEPVFDAMLEKALRLCSGAFGILNVFDGQQFHGVAMRGIPPAFAEFRKGNPAGGGAQGTAPARILAGEDVIHNLDLKDEEPYRRGDPYRRAIVDLGGARSHLAVALRTESELRGMLTIYRQEVRPFTDKEIALLQNFAGQAVIAMENARLITETREALEQQTATAEVLGVINSSPGDLAPVFEAMLERALRLCGAAFGNLLTYDGDCFQAATGVYSDPSSGERELTRPAFRPVQGGTLDRLVHGENLIYAVEVRSEVSYQTSPQFRELVNAGGYHTMVYVALRKEDRLLGAIVVFFKDTRQLTEKQIALLQNFASQAVIAMENARLITETREALEQQTATAEVLGVINASPGDLAPVFNAMLEKAMRLCDAAFGALGTFDGSTLRTAATRGVPPEYARFRMNNPPVYGAKTAPGRFIAGERLIHNIDLKAEDAYQEGEPNRRALVDIGGARSALQVALSKDDALLGSMTLYRQEVRPFTEKQIALLQNFAAQAVIAMENARLIRETREARDDAETALRDLKAAQANLIQAEKMASLGQLTAGIAHEIKNPLNFVNNFASLSVELLDELKETTGPALATLDENKRADVGDTMELLTGNLEKIAEHGKRADNIVKSMLEHSRGVSGERREVDLNGVIEEALNLAYHGARAQDESFNINLERDYAESLKPIELAPQEITRVFLNLFGNGFYAVNKRARENGDGSYRPTLTVMTRDAGDTVEVRVRDNGTGIPPEIRDKLFQPFFTTKPTGEGTGLGLSISYDIVTQQHGGTITADSEPGAFTEFTVRLPRR